MEEIINVLESNFRNSLGSFGEKLNKEVKFNGGSIWIDAYNETDNSFTVCVDHDNMNESPNVESYLEKELSARIDISDAIYEKEQEGETSVRDEYETRRVICQTYGWSW